MAEDMRSRLEPMLEEEFKMKSLFKVAVKRRNEYWVRRCMEVLKGDGVRPG